MMVCVRCMSIMNFTYEQITAHGHTSYSIGAYLRSANLAQREEVISG